jgi:Mlc titration factor MtfA (ptsG expression regulator)
MEMFGLRKRRRNLLKAEPFPAEWHDILKQGHIQVFIHEKRFEGAGGLDITDEIRVVIAAQACILLLNREADYYPLMQSIFVYPKHFHVRDRRRMPDGTILEEEVEFEGESWERGPVVLAWEEVLADAADPDDGFNVVLHEFAHQLDGESGGEDGAPPIRDRSLAESWTRVMEREYEKLRKDVEMGAPHLIDAYGAETPAEFFAVVTETFFEKPRSMKHRHPELYDLLVRYFEQDPVKRAK